MALSLFAIITCLVMVVHDGFSGVDFDFVLMIILGFFVMPVVEGK